MSQDTEALAYFDAVPALNPLNSFVWKNKAVTLRNPGRINEAEESEWHDPGQVTVQSGRGKTVKNIIGQGFSGDASCGRINADEEKFFISGSDKHRLI